MLCPQEIRVVFFYVARGLTSQNKCHLVLAGDDGVVGRALHADFHEQVVTPRR